MVLLSVTITTAAMACPNLTGEYQCYDEEAGYYTTEVAQAGQGPNTTYSLTDDEGIETIKADNKWRQMDSDSKVKASCQGRTLNLSFEQVVAGQGTIKANVAVVLNNNRDMVQTTIASFGGLQMPKQVNTCTRL